MSEVAIRVENLSKLYHLGVEQARYKTLRDTLAQAMTAPLRWFKSSPCEPQVPLSGHLWALKGVSFQVNRGEVIGIIGPNGAGKSTLLKILSRITRPTEGSVDIYGRVGSLLEVGTGFHPELTGRENIYLNGAILGMKKAEIDRKFYEIVAFAEVEKFIDTPVKHYSSGMYVRLAFAIAAHLEPEILLVDEVLAVGDAGFQKKCLGKMENVAQGGRTILFVSHNMGIISTLCERALLLRDGRIDFIGPAPKAVSAYLASFREAAGLTKEWRFEEAPGGKRAKVKSVSIADAKDIQKPYFSTTEPLFVTVEYWILHGNVPVNINLWLFDEQDHCICVVGNYKETRVKPISERGLYRSRCIIPENLLNSGRHTLGVEIVTNLSDIEVRILHCIAFETVDDHRIHSAYSKWAGIIKPEFDWQSRKLSP